MRFVAGRIVLMWVLIALEIPEMLFLKGILGLFAAIVHVVGLIIQRRYWLDQSFSHVLVDFLAVGACIAAADARGGCGGINDSFETARFAVIKCVFLMLLYTLMVLLASHVKKNNK